MHDTTLLTLIAEGYAVVPLAKGTKVPLVKWKHLQYTKPTRTEVIRNFAEWPDADIGIVTGMASNVMVLDFDAPPFSVNGTYTETPSGGRHYFYRYHDGDRHGLGVRPKLDIPWIIKIYAIPQINPGRIPIQPEARIERPKPETAFLDNKPPDFEAIKECEFIRWFLEKRDDPAWENRYPLARAYASNVIRCENPDTRLGQDYRHEDDIYQRMNPRPHSCSAIVQAGFQCPFFDVWTDCCKKSVGVTTPYGLATKVARSK